VIGIKIAYTLSIDSDFMDSFMLLGAINSLIHAEDTDSKMESAMNENEIIEISLLLSKAHLRLLEDLADAKKCSLAEAVRLLLKQSSKLR
jgi:hypothetical protein